MSSNCCTDEIVYTNWKLWVESVYNSCKVSFVICLSFPATNRICMAHSGTSVWRSSALVHYPSVHWGVQTLTYTSITFANMHKYVRTCMHSSQLVLSWHAGWRPNCASERTDTQWIYTRRVPESHQVAEDPYIEHERQASFIHVHLLWLKYYLKLLFSYITK